MEKKTELDRRGMGMSDYNNCLINKGPMGCRPPLHSKESSSDRSPFLDKVMTPDPLPNITHSYIVHGFFNEKMLYSQGRLVFWGTMENNLSRNQKIYIFKKRTI